MRARWIDLGISPPALFHASYIGLAEMQDSHALPIVLWGRTHAHFCLGASQSAATELKSHLTTPVCQRPIGGGAVWLDENQYCYVFIVPHAQLPRLPRHWFQWALAPAVATYNDFSLAATQVEHDIWLNGKKIGGSGAATINNCGVIASSFLMHFPTERFADCMRVPNSDFREALVRGLNASITDWCSHQAPPDESTLARAFQTRLETELGWICERSDFSSSELKARDEALEEVILLEEHSTIPTRRRIKLNALTFLNERNFGENWVRVVTASKTILALELSINLPKAVMAELINHELNEGTIAQCLRAHLPLKSATYWAQIICQTAAADHD